MNSEQHRIVGRAIDRLDAWGKVTGRTRYTADMIPAGAWWAGCVRSPLPRGRIVAVRRDPDFDWSRVVVVTAADLPGPNCVSMIRRDLPLLADGEVHFATQPVVLVAAPDRELLRRAVAAITLEIEPLPAALTVEQALAGDPVVWGEDNILAEYTIEHGDPAAGFARADRVVEGVYRTGYHEHVYLEPQAVVAEPRPDGGVTITGSMQCPFYVHGAVSHGLGLDPDRVVVRQAPTGGGFGGKEDYPSIIALQAAVLARAIGRPVAVVHDRQQDIAVTTKRHPSVIRHRTAVAADGTLLAAEIDVVLDGGAFTTMSPVVLSRAILHAVGPYRVPHVRIRGRAVATSTPPNGAFRGFGVPQAAFAAERHMDRIARELGIDPLELRRRNVLRRGDVLPSGQVLEEEPGVLACLERAVASSGYAQRRAELARRREADPGAPVHGGIGLALLFHGAGFTGDGEKRIGAEVAVRADSDGTVTLLVSSVEMGQGAATVLPMLAAEALGVPVDRVRYREPDTSVVPDSGPTVASRTTMVVGRLVVEACHDLLRQVRERVPDPDTDPAAAIGRAAAGGDLVGRARYRHPEELAWDPDRHRGSAYPAYSWGAVVAEVEVETDTLRVRPVRVTAVMEIGRVVNPVLAAGQVEGGLLQGLAWGYLEEMKTDDRGRYINDRMATYVVPTALDSPDITVDFLEIPTRHGPYGAKGLGELPMNGGAPALAAAVTDATGLFPNVAPATPEVLLDLATAAARGEEAP